MKKIAEDIIKFFSSVDDEIDEPMYDPVHVGAMIVIVLLSITVLFWLLWSLLVFGGGIQAKISPFLSVLFTSKAVSDFGYIGYPYEMGVFEGWVTNVVALMISSVLLVLIWKVYNHNK